MSKTLSASAAEFVPNVGIKVKKKKEDRLCPRKHKPKRKNDATAELGFFCRCSSSMYSFPSLSAGIFCDCPIHNKTPMISPAIFGLSNDDLVTDNQERRKFTEWAIFAAELERKRRIAITQSMEEQDVRDRERSGKLAIDLMERERLQRMTMQFATEAAGSNWFNDTFLSRYTLDYEVTCPYRYRGCTESCKRSHLPSHVAVCAFAHENELDPSGIPSKRQNFEGNYEVICPNSSLGCRFTCQLDQIGKHLQTCLYGGYRSLEEEEIERQLTKKLVISECEEERTRRVNEDMQAPRRRRSSSMGSPEVSRHNSVTIAPDRVNTLHTLLYAQRDAVLHELYEECHQHFQSNQTEFYSNVKPFVDAVLEELKDRIVSKWVYECQVEVFGSFATGPYSAKTWLQAEIATSSQVLNDVDVVVCFNDEMYSRLSVQKVVELLNRLAEFLSHEASDIFKVDQVITQTHMPIIKGKSCFIVPGGGKHPFRIDISIQGPTHTGLATTQMVKSVLSSLSPLGPLVLLFKEYLKSNGLGDAFLGGMPSYGVVIMTLLTILQHMRMKGGCELGNQVQSMSGSNSVSDITGLLSDCGVEPKPAGDKLISISSNFTNIHRELHTRHQQINKEPPPSPFRPRSYSRVAVVPSPNRGRCNSNPQATAAMYQGTSSFNNVEERKQYGRLVAVRLLELDETDLNLFDLSTNLPVLLKAINEHEVSDRGYGTIIEDFLALYGVSMILGKHGFSTRYGGFRFEVSIANMGGTLSASPSVRGSRSVSYSGEDDSHYAPDVRSSDLTDEVRMSISSQTVVIEHPQALDPMIIEDPINVMNNISRNCYNAHLVQRIFQEAYERLRSEYAKQSSVSGDCGEDAVKPPLLNRVFSTKSRKSIDL